MEACNPKLKTVLLLNASFSGIFGVLVTLFKDWFSSWMGVDKPVILGYIGIPLILFSGFVVHTAFRRVILKGAVGFIIFQDILWVLMSTLVLLTGWLELSAAGNLVIGMIACVVGTLAWLQKKYL